MSFFDTVVIDPDCPPDQLIIISRAQAEVYRSLGYELKQVGPVWVSEDGKKYFNWNDLPDSELLKARLTGKYTIS